MLRANIDEAFRRKLLADENRRLPSDLKDANEALARVNTSSRACWPTSSAGCMEEAASLGIARKPSPWPSPAAHRPRPPGGRSPSPNGARAGSFRAQPADRGRQGVLPAGRSRGCGSTAAPAR